MTEEKPDATNLGEILRRLLVIADEDITKAVALQKETRRRLGVCLVSLGGVSRSDLRFALKLQKRLRSKNPRTRAEAASELLEVAFKRHGEQAERAEAAVAAMAPPA